MLPVTMDQYPIDDDDHDVGWHWVVSMSMVDYYMIDVFAVERCLDKVDYSPLVV